MRAILMPLMKQLPVVGAFKAAFVDVPEFDMHLTLNGAGSALTSHLEPWVMTFVEDNVLSAYVMPQHYFYNLGQVEYIWIAYMLNTCPPLFAFVYWCQMCLHTAAIRQCLALSAKLVLLS